jgi:hypothetical protein
MGIFKKIVPQARPLKAHKGRTRIFYLTYQMSRLVLSCSTKTFQDTSEFGRENPSCLG